jgi:hypothetical protein
MTDPSSLAQYHTGDTWSIIPAFSLNDLNEFS